MTALKNTLLMSLAVLLIGCSAIGGGVKKPSDPFQVNNASAFKDKKQLAIGSFKVTFVTFDKSSSKAESSMASSDSKFAKVTLRAKLEGVDDQTFQQLTDFAYRDFADKLKENGYQLVDRSRIESSPAYSELPASTSPHRETSSFKSITGGSRESVTFSPSGIPLYHSGKSYQPAAPFEMYNVAEESGVPIVNVHYIVHFAYFRGDSNSSDKSKVARVQLGQVVRVEHGSQLALVVGHGGTFNNPNGNLDLTWGEASDMAYGETSDATSGGQKAANVFSNVVGMFSGSSMSAQEFLITAEPEKYQAAARDVIGRTSSQFVNKMVSLR